MMSTTFDKKLYLFLRNIEKQLDKLYSLRQGFSTGGFRGDFWSKTTHVDIEPIKE
jgi:hypothetical protein